LLDYDDIVLDLINQTPDLVGYAIRPFENYKNLKIGGEFLQIRRFDNSMADTKAFIVKAPLYGE